jgi:tRNA-Thr(GGU) m(6)t(6)A37 methyltransferase TsaA
MEHYTFTPIGTIHSSYKEKGNVPIQPAFSQSKGHVELYKEYERGLDNLKDFSHIILTYVFHRSEGFRLTVKPFLDDVPKGVFATRAPARPNPIGMSVVKLDSIEGNILHISKVDILDNTPLLDIKPFVPDFDMVNAKSGWLKDKVQENHVSDRRFG